MASKKEAAKIIKEWEKGLRFVTGRKMKKQELINGLPGDDEMVKDYKKWSKKQLEEYYSEGYQSAKKSRE